MPEIDLTSPISASAPIGTDPRSAPDSQQLYQRLRDLRSQVRGLERQDVQSADGAEQGQIPKRTEWRDVAALSEEILIRHAKDVEVLVWLIEARTRMDGYSGLLDCLLATESLVSEHGMDLHSIPDSEGAEKFVPLSGLNGFGRDGTLVQPLYLMPLVPQSSYGSDSLWHLQNTEYKQEIESAILAAPKPAAVEHMKTVKGCHDALTRLDDTLTQLLGAEAPSFSRLLEVLDTAYRSLRNLLGEAESVTPEPKEDQPVTEPKPTTAEITDREEAFNLLLKVAAFFHSTEPHSPVAPALETLVRRGRLDFVSLMTELIPDESARRIAMTTAGISEGDT